MCNFLSAIYLRTGKLICHSTCTDSHSELLEANKISERVTDAPVQQFVRLELVPPKEFTTDTSKWSEEIDDHEVPNWFDKAARFDAFEQMREIIREAVVSGNQGLVFEKLLIISDGSVKTRGCRVITLNGSKVEARNGSSVDARSGSKVVVRYGSSVEAYNGSSVKAYNGSKVTKV